MSSISDLSKTTKNVPKRSGAYLWKRGAVIHLSCSLKTRLFAHKQSKKCQCVFNTRASSTNNVCLTQNNAAELGRRFPEQMF